MELGTPGPMADFRKMPPLLRLDENSDSSDERTSSDFVESFNRPPPPSETGRTPPDLELITMIGAEDRLVSIHTEEDAFVTISTNMKSYRTLPSTSYSSLVSYQIPQVYDVLMTCFPDPVRRVVDATAHIGGDSILFAFVFDKAHITSIDNDASAVECLNHNIKKFSDPSRFEVIHANSVDWINTLAFEQRRGDADFYYFDPPWGGPKYYTKKEIGLMLNTTPIADVINTVFSLELTKKVLLKVPRNFAYPSFKASVKGTCRLFYIKKPQKNGSVAYGLILITDER